jgi:hypothetical protein
LSAVDIVRCNRLNAADLRIHNRADVLSMLVRMIQTKGVSKFVDQDAANIGYCIAVRTISQWAAV